ncbi:MAG: hypothetical protein P8177_10005 [Gemmatimonadota bacterium]|jgi:hypothetical protein
MTRFIRRFALVAAIFMATIPLAACGPGVGVGLNVDVPIGRHANVSIGTGTWF